jgi:arginine:pyruvate transaminase
MHLSQRIMAINSDGDDGWELFNRSRQMIADGVPVVELTLGEHDIRTDPAILAAMNAAATGGNTGYASVPGMRALRERVAARTQARTGVATDWGNVLITPGGQAALFGAHFAVCDPGERALFIDPYYATYPGTIRSAGAVPVPVPTRPEDDFQPRASAIAALATGARSLLINSPNNPTGVVYTRATLDGIAEVCRAHDVWLISDEVYETQVWDGEHLSPRAWAGMAERTLVVGSMSKSHAMTGSRCGWIIAPHDVIIKLTDLAINTNYGVPGFVQEAAVFALDQGRALETAVAAPFARRRAIAARVLAAQNVVRAVPCSGGMYLMLDIRATGLSGEVFAAILLEKERIAVMPGESFGRCAAGHLRVAMTIADDKFEAALNSLCRLAREMAP